MKIRIAARKDLEALVVIYNQAIKAGRKTAHLTVFQTEERLDWFKSHSTRQYPIFVAELENKVLGYSSLSPYRAERLALSGTAEISYYVHFDYHNQGIGTTLVNKTLEHAREIGLEKLIAILLNENEASIKLLNKSGFQEWGKMPGVAKFGEDRLDHLYFGISLNK